MGGLTFEKLVIVLVIALIVLGPERLPHYAQKLGEFVKSIKRMTDGAKDRVKEEMGDEYDEVDWKQLDPRQYDPRRIIRDALDEEERSPEARRARAVAASRARNRPAAAGGVAAATGSAATLAGPGAPSVAHESNEPTPDTAASMYDASRYIVSDFCFDDEAT